MSQFELNQTSKIAAKMEEEKIASKYYISLI